MLSTGWSVNSKGKFRCELGQGRGWGRGAGGVGLVGVGIDRAGTGKVMQYYMFLSALFMQMVMD